MPFPKEFTEKYKLTFLRDYVLNKERLLKDVLNIYEKKNNIKINLEDQIIKLKFDNLNVDCCNDNLTKIVENLISD